MTNTVTCPLCTHPLATRVVHIDSAVPDDRSLRVGHFRTEIHACYRCIFLLVDHLPECCQEALKAGMYARWNQFVAGA